MSIEGVWTALVTPFDEQGALDMKAFVNLLHHQAEAGVAGVIPCGTTGEAPALTTEEKQTLIGTAIDELKDSKTKVIAGTGSNNADLTLATSRWACERGADGVLVVTPYYNKPSQAGLTAHFRAVADAVTCPVVLYNVPSRTGVNLAPETVAALAAHPGIRALKEATGSLAVAADILDHLHASGTYLNLISGDDATFFPFQCIGGKGVISVTSNLYPGAMLDLYEATGRGDLKTARVLHRRLYPVFRDLFLECNPVPIKHALWRAGLCQPVVRPPLAPLLEQNAARLEATLGVCQVEAV